MENKVEYRPTLIITCLAVAAVGTGCVANVVYRPPPMDTPTAIIHISEHVGGPERIDVFHSFEACPSGARVPWNSDYLGSINVELRPEERSFRVPGNGYVRLVYRLGGGNTGFSYIDYHAEFVIETLPGTAYVISASRTHLQMHAEVGELRRVRCDGRIPISVPSSQQPEAEA